MFVYASVFCCYWYKQKLENYQVKYAAAWKNGCIASTHVRGERDLFRARAIDKVKKYRNRNFPVNEVWLNAEKLHSPDESERIFGFIFKSSEYSQINSS